jgi:acyl-homoserine lactone acylase PvdQ
MRLRLAAIHFVCGSLILVATDNVNAAEQVTIYRDDFGVPHIFAATEEGAAYGMGYAQAQDRLEELFRQYRRATGTMSEVFGQQFFRDDYRQRLWQHAAIAREKYGELSPKVRATIEAYQQGVRRYMKEHPSQVPAWAPPLEPWMCVALGRYIIWGWPEGDAGGDLRRGGIEPDRIEYRGSNQWLVAPVRTAYQAPIACIDPHLSWYGQFRFYEARLYGGSLEYSGMAILGMPFPVLGHNRYLSIAMTTGGPDAADCYEEEINPDNPRQYKYDGAWRDMTVRSEHIKVKGGDNITEQNIELEYTHHGPVVARKNGKAYTLKLPYFDQVQLTDQAFRMITAKNLAEMKKALAMFQFMEQNIMVGTVQGDIFYLRNARVPIRAAGYDYSRPLPGNTSQSEWLGIHALDDLVQLHNPTQGYMQNCNISPQFLTRDCPLVPSKWSERPYLFNGFASILEMAKNRDNPLHQRAAQCLDELAVEERLTTDRAIDIAMSSGVFGADKWQDRLQKAWSTAPRETREKLGPATLVQLITEWDRRCDADSIGAVQYRYWKDQFDDQTKLMDRAGMPSPASVSDTKVLDCLEKAADKLIADFNRMDVAYGEVYRVGREGGKRTWPVGGGSVRTIETPRAISFDRIGDTPNFIGRGGQTSTQVVLLTNPPRSWTVVPLGQSDHPESPHFDDQAEKLFSHGKMKPTYFLDKADLMNHVESTKVLQWE